MKYDSVIFDLDGTLWNAVGEIRESWRPLIEERGLDLPSYDEYMDAMGLTNLNFMKKLFPMLDDKEAIELFNRCYEYENKYLEKHGANQYEGVYELFEELNKERKVFIVSNCGTGYIEAYIKSMKTGKYITDFESHGATGLDKFENIKLVVERNGLLNPVYVGDTILDMQSAVKAGVDFIHANYGFGDFECDFPKIEKPLDLLNII